MTARTEYEAAYFTMLRAVEERDGLLRYRDFLHSERERLDAFAEATRGSGEHVPRRVRRPVEQTDKALLEAVGRRRAVVLDELGRMEDRIVAAEAFVTECEVEVAELRR
ncbi:MAG TPA: hypothetical protein VM287_16105 [Egibacteraceae bacterium]|nr:hypothetical protein [Egibacteraceae bacterium]